MAREAGLNQSPRYTSAIAKNRQTPLAMRGFRFSELPATANGAKHGCRRSAGHPCQAGRLGCVGWAVVSHGQLLAPLHALRPRIECS